MKARLAALHLDLALLGQRQPGLLLGCGLLIALLIAAPGLTARFGPAPEVLIVKEDPRQTHAIHAFREALLAPADLIAAQQLLLESAHRFQLDIGRVDYGDEVAVNGLSRASMRLPLSGRYADLRGFVADILKTQPALAIRQFSIERSENSGNFTVRSTLTVEFLLAEPTP